MQQSINHLDVRKFIMAGNATITLLSQKTGVHYTYKIRKAKNGDIYFVSLLTGQNNDEDYTYVGILNQDCEFHTTAKSKLTKASTPIRALDFFVKKIDQLPKELRVFHEGKCCCCGRTLTTPESIKAGIGPECAKLKWEGKVA